MTSNKINYDLIAHSYDQLYKEEQLNKLSRIKQFMIKKGFKISKNTKILDIGSGTGISTQFFSENAIGLEPSLKMIQQNNYNAVQGVAEKLPFPARCFDVVVSVTALHNFKDPLKAMKEIKRVLKPHHFLAISILKRAKQYNALKALVHKNFSCYELDEEKDTILVEIE